MSAPRTYMLVLRNGGVSTTLDSREWADANGYLYLEGGLTEEHAEARALAILGLRDEIEESLAGLEQVLASYLLWSLITFPASTAASAAAHLAKEVNQELLPNPTSAEEIADVVFLPVHLAHRAGVPLAQALRDKLDVIRLRKWGPRNAEGFQEHVRDEVTA